MAQGLFKSRKRVCSILLHLATSLEYSALGQVEQSPNTSSVILFPSPKQLNEKPTYLWVQRSNTCEIVLLDMLKVRRILESWDVPIQMLQPPMNVRIAISDRLQVCLE
jgi:hypothetical protein